MTDKVDVILQSEVDQTDKINTLVSHDPDVSWGSILLIKQNNKSTITPSLNDDDGLLVVCQILLQDEEQGPST